MQFHLTASVLNFSHLNWCNQVLTFALPRQDWSRVLSIKRLHEEVYICSKDAYKCVLWVCVLRYHLCKTPAYLPVVCDKHRRTDHAGTDKKVAGIWQSSLAWTQKHGQAHFSWRKPHLCKHRETNCASLSFSSSISCWGASVWRVNMYKGVVITKCLLVTQI